MNDMSISTDPGGVIRPEAITLEAYRAHQGKTLGVSGWLEIDQAMIDRFADVTGDRQFIHVDPARARATPFGGTIAHGFLVLSLIAILHESAVPSIKDLQMGINSGMNRIRFLTPVRAGSRIRAHFLLAECEERQPGHWRSLLEIAVEIEHLDKPALVAEWVSIWVV